MINFYELLGVKMDASKEEISTAYEEIVKKYHITINKNEINNKVVNSLNEAKEILLDDVKRTEYDITLEEITSSKQFSKDKSETYKSKLECYKNMYEEIYLTKWELFVNYILYGIDGIIKKIIKTLLFMINLLVMTIIKGICFGIIALTTLFSKGIEYLASLLLLMGVLSLFVLADESYPDYIPLIPANVENFCMFSITAFVLETFKVFVVDKSINIYALLCDFEDKIFIRILFI